MDLRAALGKKDLHFREHAERTAFLAGEIAAAMNLSAEVVLSVTYGGLLHDVGMLDVSDSILLKSAKLNADEMRAMRTYSIFRV